MVNKYCSPIDALMSKLSTDLRNKSWLCRDKLICQSFGARRHIGSLSNGMTCFGFGSPWTFVCSAKQAGHTNWATIAQLCKTLWNFALLCHNNQLWKWCVMQTAVMTHHFLLERRQRLWEYNLLQIRWIQVVTFLVKFFLCLRNGCNVRILNEVEHFWNYQKFSVI
jgi:hypothetical protein